MLFFSLDFRDTAYPCALVRWFKHVGEGPDEDTGLWLIEPEMDATGNHVTSVMHLDCIWRAAHLIGVYRNEVLPKDVTFHNTLDVFHLFYVNKFIDHHASEIAF